MLFNDPRTRDIYGDWEEVARTSVADLRMQAAEDPKATEARWGY